ncbi:ATP-binding protein [uncultured Eubacterium sp.]|uniref:ATP-binding protein n=1 Tax=uncultured Eubacterium sp. TaxID=165185 RepID=UPI0025929998|nr:sensor histidine kinase [uncultured Eubacterium sp.]
MQNTENTIYFNFSYFALKLLGKGLYSNHWTAISELVANGLDAQANCVKIYINMIDKEHSTIEIMDNGTGMSYEDLANKYVLIGKDKRMDDTVDEKLKNQFMGRKGIGKLAALYLSNKYYLLSKTKEYGEGAWCLDASNVDGSDIPHLDRCHLKSINIEAKDAWNVFETGTMIRLTNVNLTNFGVKSIEGFKARLADFYLLDELGSKIEVAIIQNTGDKIKFAEVKKSIAFKNMCVFYANTQNDLSNRLAESIKMPSDIPEIAEKERIVEKVPADFFEVSGKQKFFDDDGNEITLPYKLTGWVGIHTSIKKEEANRNDEDFLKNKTYRPNQLRLYVRRKLAVENFLDYIKNTQAFSNYIEGEISFDILDNNQLEDIATSNRQGFIEDDDRIILLVNLLKPIINYLIRKRVKLGGIVNEEEKQYREKEKERIEQEKKIALEQKKREESLRREAEERQKEEERKRKKVEDEKKEETQKRKAAEERALTLNVNLGSEKKRNDFLVDSLGEDQINFAKRLHMLKINTSTMNKVIKKQIMKLQRGKLTEKDIWDSLKRMSYLTMRMRAVLQYGALAKFNTKEEITNGDVFEFIKEYCDNILKQYEDIKVHVNNHDSDAFVIGFVPQDISIILDNVISNSIKAKANNLFINMYVENEHARIDIVDDGRGLDKNITNIEELFEFGKGYTDIGTGVGLYHIKDIVENNMHGTVSINKDIEKGFELQIRI